MLLPTGLGRRLAWVEEGRVQKHLCRRVAQAALGGVQWSFRLVEVANAAQLLEGEVDVRDLFSHAAHDSKDLLLRREALPHAEILEPPVPLLHDLVPRPLVASVLRPALRFEGELWVLRHRLLPQVP